MRSLEKKMRRGSIARACVDDRVVRGLAWDWLAVSHCHERQVKRGATAARCRLSSVHVRPELPTIDFDRDHRTPGVRPYLAR